MPALGFARENVAEMHFDVRQLHRAECIGERNVRVRPRGGVDQRAIGFLAQLRRNACSRYAAAERLNRLDQIAFVIELREREFDAEFRCDFARARVSISAVSSFRRLQARVPRDSDLGR